MARNTVVYRRGTSPTGAGLLTPPVSGTRHTPGFFYAMADRAIVFIDGNNWYHALCQVGIEHRAQLDYKRISEKLIGPRQWGQ